MFPLFVTDKGYVYIVPMKYKRQAMKDVKQLTKEVGILDVILSDAIPVGHAPDFYVIQSSSS